jgi:hypothetical protein
LEIHWIAEPAKLRSGTEGRSRSARILVGLLAEPTAPYARAVTPVDRSLDPLESPPAGEADAIARLIHLTAEQVDEQSRVGPTPRGGHSKAHGTVRARLNIAAEIPPPLAVGLFARPGSHAAWVRFSNAWGSVRPDHVRDLRGLAIALDEVEQDFLLVSEPSFFFRDAVEFAQIVEGMLGRKSRLARFFARHPASLLALLRRGAVHANPLAIRYYSVTPYRLGDWVIKYGARPLDPIPNEASGREQADGLRRAMQRTLAHRGARFAIEVQLRTDPERMPIEDAMVAWDEAASPFITVATLEIPAQRFDTPERDEFGERMAFSPWRCGPEHRPLGSVNRARRDVYAALSALRRERNAGSSPTTKGSGPN